ncbi:MAG: glycosyl transferase family 1 [Pirellulaceae bacterium]|nr:MAG: glycosyl transferase family 1 [Pirellulaceae bacterium]
MNVIVLEPFGGGSHAAWCEGWQRYSRHRVTVLDLPAVHWKWRSRHAALTLAERARQAWSAGERFEAVVCSDMLDVPAWKGLVGEPLASLPTITYFHENQLTYPLAEGQQRDYHYGYTNILSVLASDQAWFNSEFHRQEFQQAAAEWLRRMPDFRHLDLFTAAMARSRVMPPGIEPSPMSESSMSASPMSASSMSASSKSKSSGGPGGDSSRSDRRSHGFPPARPLRLGWVARWEHDKRPDRFVELVARLVREAIPFELILLGQRFARDTGDALRQLREVAGQRIRFDAFAQSPEEYWRQLGQIDVVVSTADHEFFGIGVCEAIEAGVVPLLPNRLAYPEILHRITGSPQADRYLYTSLDDAAQRLESWLSDPAAHLPPAPSMQRYHWPRMAEEYDARIESIDRSHLRCVSVRPRSKN